MRKKLWLLAKRTIQAYGEDNCSHMAAAISYYVLFSIIPLTIFTVSLFGLLVRDDDLQQDIAAEVVEFLEVQEGIPLLQIDAGAVSDQYGPEAVDDIRAAIDELPDATRQDLADRLRAGETIVIADRELTPDEVSARAQNLITDTLEGVSDVSGALTIVGLVGMAWAASAMFGAVRKSLNIAWDVEVHRPVVQQKLVDLSFVLGLGVLLMLSVAGTATLRTIRALSDDALGPLSTGTGFVWSVMPLLLPAVFSFLVFLIIYRFVPNTYTPFRNIWPGAVVATILFELLKNLFALYVANFNNYAGAYGALGVVLLFLLWTYLTCNILLLGAEISSEYPRVMRGDYDDEEESGPTRPLRESILIAIRNLFLHPVDGEVERTPAKHSTKESQDER